MITTMSKAFVVQMQVQSGRDWLDLDIPELVEAGRPDDTGYEVGVDWAVEHIDPAQPGTWRLLVWSADTDSQRTESVVTPVDLPTATRGTHVLRSARPKHRPRTRGPVFPVVTKRRLDTDLIGTHILITTDRRNSAAPDCPGPWYPAREPAGAVRAFVRGVGRLHGFRGRDWQTVETAAGTISLLPDTLNVIPAEPGQEDR